MNNQETGGLLTHKSYETEADYSNLKINLLAGISVFLALTFSFFLHQFVFDWSGNNLMAALSAASLFLSVSFLEAVFIKDFGRLLSVLFLNVLALLVPFYAESLKFLIWGTLLAYLFFILGAWNAKKELNYSLKIKTFRISGTFLKKAVSGLSFFLVTAYLGSMPSGALPISRDVFIKIMSPADFILNYWYPGLSMKDTFSGGAKKIISANYSQSAAFLSLSVKDREAALFNGIPDIKKNFEEKLGIKIDENQTLSEITYTAFNEYMSRLYGAGNFYLAVVAALILYFIVRSFGVPFYWLVSIIAVVIYEVLIIFGFASMILETRSKDVVILK